ncbi:unnamed protein product, partial [Arabidopsis halleri]
SLDPSSDKRDHCSKRRIRFSSVFLEKLRTHFKNIKEKYQTNIMITRSTAVWGSFKGWIWAELLFQG